MRHLLAAAAIASIGFSLAPAVPNAEASDCQFKLGFKAIAEQLGAAVGVCEEDEHYNTQNGDSLQKTTGGLLVWRKADNFTAFTDGYRSWVNGPFGLQQRLNSEAFDWERRALPPAAGPADAGTVLLADSLDAPTTGVLPVTSPDPAHFAAGYVSGEYMLRKTEPSWIYTAAVRLPGQYDDATIGVDVRVVGEATDRWVGVGCRGLGLAPSTAVYALFIAPESGRFELHRQDPGRSVFLAGPTSSSAIHGGGSVNRLELSCVGTTIKASINGRQVASVQDAYYRRGDFRIGVNAGSTLIGATAEARFTNLRVTPR